MSKKSIENTKLKRQIHSQIRHNFGMQAGALFYTQAILI